MVSVSKQETALTRSQLQAKGTVLDGMVSPSYLEKIPRRGIKRGEKGQDQRGNGEGCRVRGRRRAGGAPSFRSPLHNKLNSPEGGHVSKPNVRVRKGTISTRRKANGRARSNSLLKKREYSNPQTDMALILSLRA